MDAFEKHSPSLTAPAQNAAEVIPNDDEDLAYITRAIYVGVGGDLSVEMAKGNRVVFASLTAGTLLPVRVARILATGTSASDVLALW